MMRPIAFLAILLLTAGLPAQIINEIMYNPVEETAPGVEDKRYEWIELYNPNADPVDLSGYTFDGVSFTFPPGAYMQGYSYLVVCANEFTVRTKYGINNVIGNWSTTTALDNSGEAISLRTNSGREISRVSYNDRGRWPAGADGAGHSLALLTPFSDIDDPDSWALSPTLGGSPGGPNFGGQASVNDTVIIQDNEVWNYFKGTVAPPANWNQVAFNDSTWLTGQTGIGYGDGDDRTILTDMQNGYMTIFCRRRFTANPAAVSRLVFSITYDDGFYAYLNGVEVASRNVNSRAFDAPAPTAGEPTFEEIDITAFKDQLTNGSNNVLAVQVHNAGLSSSDLSFIPKLVSREIISPEVTATAPVVINEGFLFTTGERWVELFNTSTSPVDLSGFYITDDRHDLLKAKLIPGTTIPARGFLAFTDAQLGLNFSLTSPVPRERVFVALVNAAGTRVVNSFAFKPQVPDRSEARVPDGDETFEPAATPTRAAANAVDIVGGGNVVINEIMYHPISGDHDLEYIELFNRGGAAVNLNGFQFTRGIEYLFGNVTIGPGGYLVVARNPDRIASVYGLPRAQVLGPWYNLKTDAQGNPVQTPAVLADAGERITLEDPNGNTADTVRYHEGGEWAFWADGRGSSLELIDPNQDNNAGAAWDASDDSSKSVPRTFTYTSRHAGGESELQLLLLDRGIAVVDNISLRSGATEHIANGGFESNTSGWNIQGTHVYSGRITDPDLVINGNGSLKMIATGGGDNKVNRIETNPDVSPALNTSTTYTVSLTARWIVGARHLLTRGYNHGLARSHVLDIPARLGTPGAINSVTQRQIDIAGAANIGPIIDKVRHDPVVPETNQSVVVTARVRDSDGIRPGSVRVLYALNTPPSTTGGFTSLAMTGPDARDRYTATIPGQTNGTRVLFFITAEDNTPARLPGRFPLDHTRRTHPTLLNPAAPNLAALHYAMYRHDVQLPSTRYHSYRFVMHQANVDYLTTRPVQSNDLVDGTFIFGAERSYYGARLRWSGSPWLRTSPSYGNSYRVRFAGDDIFHDRIKSFNLENHSTDGRERISHYLIRYNNVPGIKVPYAEPWYARWQVNNQVNSTYEHVPQPDNDYISAWYPDDDNGDFFEMDDRFEFNDSGGRVSNQDGRLTYPPYSNSIYPTPDPAQNYVSWKENYRYYHNIRANQNEDDYSNLIEFSKILDRTQTSDSAFDSAIGSYADIEAFLRVWAVRMNTDDWDTWGTSRGKNCYLYRRPSDGLWVLIPWDMELTYGNVSSFGLPASPSGGISINGLFPEVSRMINRPFIKRRYYGVLKEMVDRQFNSAFLSPWMNLLSANGTGNTGVGQPGGYIDQRAALIRSWIGPVVAPQQRLVITTNGGNPIATPNATIDISGNAPVEVYQILVTRGGVPLAQQPQIEFSKSSMTGWTARGILLVPGLNDLRFIGFTADPEVPVDSDAIDITFTGNWNPPAITSLAPVSGAAGIPIDIQGTDFHTGLRVFFGAVEAASVTFNEGGNPGTIRAVVPSGLPQGDVGVKVRNIDNQESALKTFSVTASFIRGDANLSADVDIADAVKILVVLFGGGSTTCLDALDANDDGAADTTDAIHLLTYLFLKGPAPAAPFPAKGGDPTGDSLSCEQGI